MTKTCVLKKCRSKKHQTPCRFFLFPSKSYNPHISRLNTKRRKLWIEALKLEENFRWKHKFVCSRHFCSGEPARATDEHHTDWVPTENLPQPDDSSSITSSSSRSLSSVDSSEIGGIEDGPNSYSVYQTFSTIGAIQPEGSIFGESLDDSGHSATSGSDQQDDGRDNSERVSENLVGSLLKSVQPQSIDEEVGGSDIFLGDSLQDDSGIGRTIHTEDVGVQVGPLPTTHNITFQRYYNEMTRLQSQCYKLEEQALSYQRGIHFLSSDAKCNYYTGMTRDVMTKLLKYVEPYLDEPYCSLSTDQMFVMTLTKLRLNTPLASLAYDYNVCDNTISKYFHRTLYIIYQCCQWAIKPTAVSNLLRHTPSAFQEVYGKRRIFLVDCFEIRCETPGNLKAAASHYSNYKKCETVKFLIAAHPDGTICFVSAGFAGRCSDKEIVIQSGFLECLEENDVVVADKGFNIGEMVKQRKAILNIPNFLRNKKQFSPSELMADKQITSLRIHIEKIIGMLRDKFKILHEVLIMKTLVRSQNGINVVDLIVKVACILCNLNKSII